MNQGASDAKRIHERAGLVSVPFLDEPMAPPEVGHGVEQAQLADLGLASRLRRIRQGGRSVALREER
ncbi:MAG: hypothetical protein L0H94_15530 [Nitrospira sp.]|nr:hypothetical protein [Nitrospira sp.]